MKIYIKKLIVCLCSLLSLPVVAEETIHFDYIDTKGYEVFCVFRDTDDIVWLGTSNGLTTYAQLEGGFPFSYVRHPRLNDIIKRIDQDNLGRLWLETQSLDVLIYDSHTNQLISTVDQYLRTFGIYMCRAGYGSVRTTRYICVTSRKARQPCTRFLPPMVTFRRLK